MGQFMIWKPEFILLLNIKGGNMKIIYSDYYCWPLPLAAVYIHLKLLEGKKNMKLNDLDDISSLGKKLLKNPGKVYKIARDKYGNELYISGNQGIGEVIERVISGVNKIIDNKDEFLFVNFNKQYDIIYKLLVNLFSYQFFNKLASIIIRKHLEENLIIVEKEVFKIIVDLDKEFKQC